MADNVSLGSVPTIPFSGSIDSPLLPPQPATDPVNANSSAIDQPFSDRVVCYLIGVLLLLTATAKFWMLISDSFADVRVGISKEVLWFSV